MGDVFVDIDDEFIDVEDDFVDEIVKDSVQKVTAFGGTYDDDDFIDIDQVEVDSTYDDVSDKSMRRIIRHDAFNRVISDTRKEPASFRYSRQDGDLSHPILPNPVTEKFNEYQSAIKRVSDSKLPAWQKRKIVWALIMKFRGEMETANIRYRNIHHHLQTYGVLPVHKW